ncbi:MAG: hypothetical protein A2283_22450 [Lentisphaerae bacterium RIFOXYA12_FULL_48_11]|nr:MAG: hypothetical protein A2283_22450 [Lentisphaerae bacterium RIFOXYA12_FULL_48_11]
MIVQAKCVLLMCLLFYLRPVYGVPVIGTTETWDSGTFAASGWANQPGSPPSGGAQAVTTDSIGPETAVRIMFGDQGAGPYDFEDEKIYATASAQGGNFLGDFNAVDSDIQVNFSFYADDYTTANNTLAMFFYSSTGNRTWKYSLSGPALIDTWYDYAVPMVWSGGWTSPGAGQTEFLADLSDVDQLGIWVYRSADLPAQNYWLDDFSFGLLVPEPSTYAMLAFTFLTMALTLRRKQFLSLVRVRISRQS